VTHNGNWDRGYTADALAYRPLDAADASYRMLHEYDRSSGEGFPLPAPMFCPRIHQDGASLLPFEFAVMFLVLMPCHVPLERGLARIAWTVYSKECIMVIFQGDVDLGRFIDAIHNRGMTP
jgi:hypothetical protein